LKGAGGYIKIGELVLSGFPSTYTVGKTTIGNDLQLFGKIITSTSQVVGNLVFNNRPSQNYQDPSYNSMIGYYALDHKKAPVVNYEIAKQSVSTWTARYNPGVAMGKVCWSSKLMIFCAVGSTNSYVSSDGITWSSYLIQAGITYNDVVWSNELNIFCAVGQSGIVDSTNLIATSPNGTTWTIQTHNPVNSVGGLKAIDWSPELKIFNATGSYQTNGFQTSYDGITWASTGAMGNTTGIVWANSLKSFIICSNNGNFGIGSGTTYSPVYSPPTNTRDLVWSEQLGMLITFYGTRVYYSYDGRIWNVVNNLTLTASCVCTWAAELGIFCLIDGSNNCYTSSNGLDWTFIRTMTEFTGTIVSGKNLCWSPELSIFCLGPNVAGQSFLTSSLKFRIPTSSNTFNGIDESGNWAITKKLTVNEDVSLNAGLRVAADASFNNSIYVNGNINLAGALTLGYTTAPTLQTQMGYITEASGNLVNYTSSTNSQPIADWTTGTPKTLSKGVWMIHYYIYANDAQTFNITDIRSGLSTTTSGAYTWNVRDLYHRCPTTFTTASSEFDFCKQITGILNVPASTSYTFDVNLATSVSTSDWNFSIKAVRIG
jgi:hypothetical protein